MKCYNFRNGDITVKFSRDNNLIKGNIRIKKELLNGPCTIVERSACGVDVKIISLYTMETSPEEITFCFPKVFIRTEKGMEYCEVKLNNQNVKVSIYFKERSLKKQLKTKGYCNKGYHSKKFIKR